MYVSEVGLVLVGLAAYRGPKTKRASIGFQGTFMNSAILLTCIGFTFTSLTLAEGSASQPIRPNRQPNQVINNSSRLIALSIFQLFPCLQLAIHSLFSVWVAS